LLLAAAAAAAAASVRCFTIPKRFGRWWFVCLNQPNSRTATDEKGESPGGTDGWLGTYGVR
jgi:hypothetical protein